MHQGYGLGVRVSEGMHPDFRAASSELSTLHYGGRPVNIQPREQRRGTLTRTRRRPTKTPSHRGSVESTMRRRRHDLAYGHSLVSYAVPRAPASLTEAQDLSRGPHVRTSRTLPPLARARRRADAPPTTALSLIARRHTGQTPAVQGCAPHQGPSSTQGRRLFVFYGTGRPGGGAACACVRRWHDWRRQAASSCYLHRLVLRH